MFVAMLAGGLAIAVAIGIVDVVYLHADAINTKGRSARE